jgi:hypothetical protein
LTGIASAEQPKHGTEPTNIRRFEASCGRPTVGESGIVATIVRIDMGTVG